MAMCENCGQRPVALVMQQQVGGQETTLRLCNHCASALQGGGAHLGMGELGGLLERLMEPRPRRGNLLAQLSEQAQRVLERAARRTLEWGHERVVPEFLLLALLEEVPELREALEQSGVPVQEYEARLESVVPRRAPRQSPSVGMAASTKRVLQLARSQAMQLGHNYIGPEHLLLGLINDGETFAAQFLKRADPEGMRERVAAKQRLAERGYDPQMGARPLRRLIQRELETDVSRMMLRGELREGDTVRVDADGARFTFEAVRGASAAPQATPEAPEAGASAPH